METRSGKNKGKALCDGDHGDDEEENMEKFFQLVKNIRGARDYVVNYGSDDLKLENVEGDKRRRVEDERMQLHATWKPTFQPQDFQVNTSSSTVQSNDGTEKDEMKRISGLGLDLNFPP
ncbi:protein NIM1-INTERACTING 3 [Apium graveolens]|uniref:protein NIM1-INTERACTING 3 n=1 Tax=Apium graveolens TaxID=4045 RepID=UPI003D7B5A58